MTYFLTGASGFIGTVVLRQLLERAGPEDQVYAFCRRPLKRILDPRVQELIGDLSEISHFKNEVLSSDFILHLAADARFGANVDYALTNTKPVGDLISILEESTQLKRFLFVSTIGAIDRAPSDQCDLPLDVSSKPSPKSEYGRSKLNAEVLLRKSHLPFTIVRPTWVYGTGMRANSHLKVFTRWIRSGLPVAYFAFPGRVSLIHVEDLAAGLISVVSSPTSLGETYFAETESMSIGKILSSLSGALNLPVRFQFSLPGIQSVIKSLHSKLPLSIANLFVSYLWASDSRFIQFLEGRKPRMLCDHLPDVTGLGTDGLIVITGANAGIGLELARQFRARGDKLILIDRDTSEIEKFFDSEVRRVDLSDKTAVLQMANKLKSSPIKLLINNAGIGSKGFFESSARSQVEAMIDVNVRAPILIVHELLEDLKRSRATIVNIGSSVGYDPLPGMAVYAATKSFLINWSEALSWELQNTNAVITFSPSGTRTQFQKTAGVEATNDLMPVETVASEIIRYSDNARSRSVILGGKSKILMFVGRFLSRAANLRLRGMLFAKLR